MKLNAKVGLIVTATVLVAGVGTLYVIWQLLVKNVRAEIEGNAQTVMDAALAVRAYTVDSKHGIRAVLHNDADDFYPQTVPAYAARQVTDRLRKTQQVSYREAMANPTNPVNRLGEHDVELYRAFRENPDMTRSTGTWMIGGKRYRYLAMPIIVKNPACLSCHGDPKNAPPAMRKIYGDHNGFGWKLGEVLGVRVATVPADVAYHRVHEEFRTFAVAIMAVGVLVAIVVYMILRAMVIRPIMHVVDHTENLANGHFDGEEFVVPDGKHDEISLLKRAMNRMRRSYIATDHLVRRLSKEMKLMKHSMQGAQRVRRR